MRTQTIEVYTYDELDEAAQEKARDWFRETSAEVDFWSGSVIDEADEQARFLGIEIGTQDVPLRNGKFRQELKIWWSGFWSQGDGACFEGTWRACDVKADKVADGWGEDPATTGIKRIAKEFDEIAKAYPEASFEVKHSGRYYHSYSTDFTVSLGEACDGDGCEPTISQEEWSKAEEQIIKAARDFMDWIYRQLEKEYEYQNSDEVVAENILADEYEFTKDGSRKVYL